VFSKVVIFAAAVILAAPIYAGSSSSSSTGGSSTGAGAGGHSGGGGGGGQGGGATGGAGRSSGLSGRAAAATARSVVDGRELSSHGGLSPTNAMRATHLAAYKPSAGEHTTSKLPSMGHHRCYPYRCEPKYRSEIDKQLIPECMPRADWNSSWSWFDCNGPTKSNPGHKP
jgi:hypothetical protein